MSYVPHGSKGILEGKARHQTDIISERNFNPPGRPPSGLKKNSPRRPRVVEPPAPPIIVHSHLRWDWVWQRPQQFVSRLSRRHRVLFVETLSPDPQLSSSLVRFYTPDGFPGVTVLQIQFPTWRWSDAAFVDRRRRELVKEFLRGPGAGQFDDPVQWFYDPMAVTAFASRMGEVLTVYDCMDELSQFRAAPPEIAAREAELLERADVVFTGGRKLYEAKRLRNDNCHFYGCGVEVAHFTKALARETAVPGDLAALRKPVLGYFGVIDERLDYDLLEQLARANPDGSVVLIGPVLKVDESSLPREANLHWLGRREYGDLPAYCKGFDLCLMPFALNESTEFINPTKALEYMAAGRVIVSTAVSDVIHNFGSVVKVARDADDFIRLCREAIRQPDAGAIARGLRLAQQNSWDSIVEHLEERVTEALLKNRVARVVA